VQETGRPFAVGRPPPAWLPGRVWYHLHSLRAAAAPDNNPDVTACAPTGRGLRRLSEWLDHVAGLGCGGILLTPIFVSMTHGYDAVDHFRIDQRLGDEDDLAAFIKACHDRNLKVLLDGVFNHVGRDFPGFRDVLAHGAASPRVGWFRLDFSRDGGDGFAYRTFEGHRELVALNHHSPEVLDWAVAVAQHWLDRGVDGWRLDAAYAILPAFLAEFSARVLEKHPDAFLFGEMIHGDQVGFVRQTGLHSVTQYELHKAIWSSLNDANFFELRWALQRHETFARAFVPFTFVGNHDVTRLLTHLRNPSHLGHALAVLFTVPGTPCVYYGDEFAFRGRKGHGARGDDAVRPRLPDSPFAQNAEQAAAFELHRQLIAMRAQRPWLTTGHLQVVELTTEQIRYTVAGGDGELLVVLDVAASGSTPLDVERWQRIAGAELSDDGRLPAGSWSIWARR
jgi:cyclomaltodextrinase